MQLCWKTFEAKKLVIFERCVSSKVPRKLSKSGRFLYWTASKNAIHDAIGSALNIRAHGSEVVNNGALTSFL